MAIDPKRVKEILETADLSDEAARAASLDKAGPDEAGADRRSGDHPIEFVSNRLNISLTQPPRLRKITQRTGAAPPPMIRTRPPGDTPHPQDWGQLCLSPPGGYPSRRCPVRLLHPRGLEMPGCPEVLGTAVVPERLGPPR